MGKFSDLFCIIFILALVIVNVFFFSFDAGEPPWGFIIFSVVEISMLIIYHYISKDQISEKREKSLKKNFF